MLTLLRGVLHSMVALGVVVAMGACATSDVSYSTDPADYASEEQALQERLSEDPSKAEALRDLGVIYVRTERDPQGREVLQRAHEEDDTDPKTLFYLGIANERTDRLDEALNLFEKYDQVPKESRYRSLMEGRYESMVRKQARDELRALLDEEEDLADTTPSMDVMAVMPLGYRGVSEQYEPLGRGLAEMMITDLAQIEALRIVERIRLQALLDELALAETDYIDGDTAPRVGKLLGAGRLLGGSFRVTQTEDIRMDVAMVTLDGEDAPDMPTQVGSLSDLFELQKELVAQVLDALDVELTSEERAAFEEPPTNDLNAFLAFSRGLQEEDRGNFEAAARHYQQAQVLDPAFEAPAARQESVESMSAGGGTAQNALSNAARPTGEELAALLLQQRLNNMGRGHLPIDDLIDEIQRTPGTDIDVPRDELPPPPDPPAPAP